MAEERKKLTLSLGEAKPKISINTGVKVEVKKKRTFQNITSGDDKKITYSAQELEKAKKLQALLDKAKKEEEKAKATTETLQKEKAKKRKLEEAEQKKKEEEKIKRQEEKAKKFEEKKEATLENANNSTDEEVNKIDWKKSHSDWRKPKDEALETEDFKKKKFAKASGFEDEKRKKFSKGKWQYNIESTEEDLDAEQKPKALNVGLKKLRSQKNLIDKKPKEKVLKFIELPEVI